MWGGVGRGKSAMMDLFYDAIPFRRKMRMHFHHFMRQVHQELNALSGQADPLEKVADKLYAQAVVICFDEFFVSHVTDAMILGDLFAMLFKRGITLVATSNVNADDLYRNGIHRDRFMPAIARLQKYCAVLNIDSGIDYRLRVLEQAHMFISPLGPASAAWMQDLFTQLVSDSQYGQGQEIVVNHRPLQARATSDSVLWVDFSELCQRARSAADYIELANRYEMLLVDNVPELNDVMAEATRRFVYLIDEMYDRNVKVVVASQAPILQLYSGLKLQFEIQRTRSRLLEMQSHEYLERPHITL
jgi:cell division protein ZapE